MPTILVLVAGLLFLVTFEIDWAAYHHHLHLPFWIESGSADAARQVLIAIAAAVITVIGVVFSITILALTLASQQFGPRMMRNFVRDIGNQVTLATFVATFVYSVLALVSITSIPNHPDFVPHLSVTVAEALLLVDLAVLIYFIHHIAKSIQLPEVIAGIAADLMRAIDAEFPMGGADENLPFLTGNEKSVPELLKLLDERGGTVTADSSGYLQFVGYAQLVTIAVTDGRRHPAQLPPGPLRCRRWAAGYSMAPRCGGAGQVGPRRSTRDRPAPDAHAGSRLRY